jgi:hypothetical protein
MRRDGFDDLAQVELRIVGLADMDHEPVPFGDAPFSRALSREKI